MTTRRSEWATRRMGDVSYVIPPKAQSEMLERAFSSILVPPFLSMEAMKVAPWKTIVVSPPRKPGWGEYRWKTAILSPYSNVADEYEREQERVAKERFASSHFVRLPHSNVVVWVPPRY
jgi:hypothetical protein